MSHAHEILYAIHSQESEKYEESPVSHESEEPEESHESHESPVSHESEESEESEEEEDHKGHSDSEDEDEEEDEKKPSDLLPTQEAVRQARVALSIQKKTLNAIYKAIHHEEQRIVRIQCHVLQKQAAHEAARLRLTIGRVTLLKERRLEVALERLQIVQHELSVVQDSLASLRRSHQEGHERLPVLQEELEAARIAHKEVMRIRTKQRLQDAKDERLYQKERQAIGHLPRSSSSPLSVYVKLLSGDLLTVHVASEDCIELFPRQFAEQHHYHLSIIPHMTFYVSQESEESEDTPLVTGTSHSKGTRRLWKDVFPQQPPMLLFLLQENQDPTRDDKIQLIHTILQRQGLAILMENEELWSLYQTWALHCSVPLNANRWQRLSSFVHEHLSLAVPFTEEMKAQREREARIARRIQQDSLLLQSFTEELRTELTGLLERIRPFLPLNYPPLPSSFYHRYSSPTGLLQQIHRLCLSRPNVLLSTYGIHCLLLVLRESFPLSSFADLRLSVSSLCDCHHVDCYVCHYEKDNAL